MARLVGETVAALGKVFSPSGHRALRQDGDRTPRAGSPTTSERPLGRRDRRRRQLDRRTATTGGSLLDLLASINVFVALFNLLPLPPLDGGHAAVAVYEGDRVAVSAAAGYGSTTRSSCPWPAVVVVLDPDAVGLSTIYLDLRSL